MQQVPWPWIVVVGAWVVGARAQQEPRPALGALARFLTDVDATGPAAEDTEAESRVHKRWLGVRGIWDGLQPWLQRPDQQLNAERPPRSKGTFAPFFPVYLSPLELSCCRSAMSP